MEVTTSTPIPPFPTSQFTPKFATTLSFSSRNRRSSIQFRVSISKFIPSPSISLLSPPLLPITRSLTVSARLGPSRTRRRNTLRKKLVGDQKVSSNTSKSLNYDHFNTKIETFGENESKGGELVNNCDDCEARSEVEAKKSEKVLGESVLGTRLENWVDQYKADIELWGVGSGPIFTVYQDSDGTVKNVEVNEDEILRRNQIVARDNEESKNVSLKILHAKALAREMERGENVIPRKSSIVKFVVAGTESGFVGMIRSLPLRLETIRRLNLAGVGRMFVFGFVLLFTVKFMFGSRKEEVRYTPFEKEMMRRKMKKRQEKEMFVKGHLEVIEKDAESTFASSISPELDKQELVRSIQGAKHLKTTLKVQDDGEYEEKTTSLMNDRIEEIRTMGKRVREAYQVEEYGREDLVVGNELPHEKEGIEMHGEEGTTSLDDLQARNREKVEPINRAAINSICIPTDESARSVDEAAQEVKGQTHANNAFLGFAHSCGESVKDNDSKFHHSNAKKIVPSSNVPDNKPPIGNSVRKPRIIRSVKEAREYLSTKHEIQKENQEMKWEIKAEGDVDLKLPFGGTSRSTRRKFNMGKDEIKPSSFGGESDSAAPETAIENLTVPNIKTAAPNSSNSIIFEEEVEPCDLQNSKESLNQEFIGKAFDSNSSAKASNCIEEKLEEFNPQVEDREVNGQISDSESSVKAANWIEDNFNELKPLMEKMGVGFKDNYMVAREKVNQQLNVVTELSQLDLDPNEDELEWMKDDYLREIVFQVRDNELAGRDPFYSLKVEEKQAFFEGLEKKVEKENQKLSKLHEYLHSNIENLDYGADGISVYDPLDKIIPRWKGPIAVENPEARAILEKQRAFLSGKSGVLHPMKKDEQNLQKPSGSFPNDKTAASLETSNLSNDDHEDLGKNKTVIEGSDGSIRAGKKSGKEYWQHTKKWSRGFLDSYNAEPDPEVKSIMSNIGKDLDRWITEKEIQEAAELMDKLPEKNKMYMKKKLDKLKREMELFGPQAVVSKYREYAEVKEEDYLWWLDLPHVLCIELYTLQDGEQQVGFYALEMATDLELEPKPQHVIAFEDSCDCKNLCYIIQAHMDMLGNGHAFIVPHPPKDAFREAKANGFSVTVIRKGELELNVDQTLEEVEEQIIELGSKIYHDMIMKEHSVDISGLMKGVFGVNGTHKNRRKSRGMIKKGFKK